MKNVKNNFGGTAAEDWEMMNSRNRKMMSEFMESDRTQVNQGRQIGVRMIEWVD